MTPINTDQVQRTVQILLAYLEDPRNNTPNDMLEGIISGKSLLRGILNGNLVVCQKANPVQDPPLVVPEGDPSPPGEPELE